MSRVGNLPVQIPAGVEVSVKDNVVTVKGPKGELQQSYDPLITVKVDGDEVVVTRANDERQARSLHGLTRSLINNMTIGVTEGYSKTLELVGVGYRASLKGNQLELSVGYSHPVYVEAPEGIKLECPDQTHITVSGINKQLVGQVAADIRKWRKPEPYKGKGIRYEGEHVRHKEGKTAG
ncbi:MAG: 50S ribosomal protein L6 [Coriobacteriaceae bacterium]|nr:50S ribosomal protein L6 [Coriobacteriaceae bacterium]